MQEIDEMDIIGYFKIMAWKMRKEKTPKHKFIDEVWDMSSM